VGRARGEIELDDNVLVIKRIHVEYSGVEVPEDRREAADRALATHQQACPVSRSIAAAIEVTTAWALPAGS
jgi:uncharacterized OsmC-like protein